MEKMAPILPSISQILMVILAVKIVFNPILASPTPMLPLSTIMVTLVLMPISKILALVLILAELR